MALFVQQMRGSLFAVPGKKRLRNISTSKEILFSQILSGLQRSSWTRFYSVNHKISIVHESTPNPLSVRFVPSLTPAGFSFLTERTESAEYNRNQKVEKLPELAKTLFVNFAIIRSVLISKEFLSCNAVDEVDDDVWDSVANHIEGVLNKSVERYVRNNPDSHESHSVIENQSSYVDEIEKDILELLETRVKPNLQLDGGDVIYRGYDSKTRIVKLKLIGSCAGCPSSTSTLNFSIRNLLTHMIEEVDGVEQVFDEEDDLGDGSDWIG